MARYQKSGAQRAKPNDPVKRTAGRRPATTPPAIEDTMFFPRLRRHAKWMFVLLALVFALGFVVFGVGAGGTGIGDIFRDQGGTSSGQSVSDAQKQAVLPAVASGTRITAHYDAMNAGAVFETHKAKEEVHAATSPRARRAPCLECQAPKSDSTIRATITSTMSQAATSCRFEN